MGKLPVVAVVGRPNVGKSTLFNRILHRKIAVVNDQSGVTRDRNYMEAHWSGVDFTLIDTGGMMPDSKEDMENEINHQVEIALGEADVVVFMVSADVEPTDLDEEIARQFRKTCAKKVILVVNKAESTYADMMLASYWSLGLGEPYGISSLHGKGVGDMLDLVLEKIEENYDPSNATNFDYDIKMAIVGRPNAGKSSLVNKLLGDDRVIVTNLPGTTRDSIDTAFDYNDKRVKLIDTAGMRKKGQVKDDVEYYSNLRSLGSINRCDIAVLLIDTDRRLAEQDMKIIRHIQKERKGLIICWNKWDLVSKTHRTFDQIVKETRAEYKDLENIPMLSISAMTGKRVHDVLELALNVKEEMSYQVNRNELEDQFFTWIKRFPHPYIVGETVRFMGLKQQKSTYPHFIVFCTNPHRVTEAYQRFLKNKLYKLYKYSGTFIVIDFKGIGRRRGESSGDGGGEPQSFGVMSYEV